MTAERGKTLNVTIKAAADLSTMQYKIITIAGAIAAESDTAIGSLINKPQSGEWANVDYLGQMKGYAAAAVVQGARLKVTTSGYLTTVASGDGACVGKALEAASSGDLFKFIGNFANANTLFDQQ